MRLVVTALLLSLTLPAFAAEKWIRLTTPNFEVITSSSEKKARETALYFEQLREFFISYWKTKPDPGTPVRIILFDSAKQFDPYKPGENVAGYFQHGIDRDWIVLGPSPNGWEGLVCHEYTHLMVKQSGLKLPVWLNEGIAEIYSTFKPMGDKVQIGNLIQGHFYAIQQGWVPVPRLLEVKNGDPEYRTKHTGQFYAGSWGLTHMLMLGQDDRQHRAAFLQAIMSGKTPTEAYAASSLTPQVLEGDLRNYLKNNDRFYAGLIPFKSQRSSASWTATPLSAPAVDATLALLQAHSPEKRSAAKQRMTTLDTATWQTHEALAYSTWLDGAADKAWPHFQKAIELGADSAKLYYDASRAALYAGKRNEEPLAYLRKAMDLYPDWPEARIQLLEQLIYLGKYQDANSLRTTFKSVSPANASRLFRGVAMVELALGAAPQAKAAIERARQYARTDFDTAECDRIEQHIRYLSARAQSEKDRGAAIAAALQQSSEVFENSPPTQPKLILPEGSIQLVGTLLNIDCAAAPILKVQPANGSPIEIQLSDPTKVNNYLVSAGQTTPKLDLSCGEQSRAVLIHYRPALPGQKYGELNAIEFK